MLLEVGTIQVDSGKVCVTKVGIREAALTSLVSPFKLSTIFRRRIAVW